MHRGPSKLTGISNVCEAGGPVHGEGRKGTDADRDHAGADLRKYRAAVFLRDGSRCCLRPIRLNDEDKLLALFSRVSPYTLYLRFHHVIGQIPREEAHRSCAVDYENTFALVATVGAGRGERIVAVGHFYRLPSKDGAELALMVEDAYQGRGVGTHLLEHLVMVAREKRVRRFHAEVTSDNQRGLRLLEHRGWRVNQDLEYGVCHAVLPIAPAARFKAGSTSR